MYEDLPLDALVPNPENANRVSRMFGKKLLHNIEQMGKYETLTVRPHPNMKDKFEILNGHARLEVLRALGTTTAKCDVWEVTEFEGRMFLAVLNRLRGSDVPELRMKLLFELLGQHSKEELAACIPETASYLAKLEQLPEAADREQARKPAEKPDGVIVDFYLTHEQRRVVCAAVDNISKKFKLTDSSQALAKMAELYLARSGAGEAQH